MAIEPARGEPAEPDQPSESSESSESSETESAELSELSERRLRMIRLVDDAVETEMLTGHPEETVEEAKKHLLVRLARIVGGSAVTLAGLAMLALPGPGLVVVAIGLAILAPDVPFAARLLDVVRSRLPQDAEGKISLPGSAIVMMVLCAVCATAGSLWWTFGRNR